MPEEHLKSTLQELEAELHNLDSLDDATRELLAEMMEEIAATLRDKGAAHLEHQSLIKQFEKVGQQFEHSHPTITGIVNRVVDFLGQLGI